MGIDFSRVATSALQAALEDGQQPEPKQHRRRLTAGKAIVGGAALVLAAKYAVDKTSGLKGKAAMAGLRHAARSTIGDVVPESLHDKLMDSGFFDHEDDFDLDDESLEGPDGEAPVDEQDFFHDDDEDEEFAEPEDEDAEEPEDEGEPEDEDLDEPEDEDLPDEPEDEEFDEPEDDVDEDDEPDDGEDDEPEDEPDDEPEGDAEAEPEDEADEDEEPRDEEGAERAARAAPANGRAEAPGVMDVLSSAPRRRRRTRRSTPAERPPAPPKKRSTKKKAASR